MELEIVRSKRERSETAAAANNQQNTHRDDEAHAYMWSILTLISKNFPLTCFFFTNKNISIELVQWNRTWNVEEQKKRQRKKPETIGKAQKLVFMLSRNTSKAGHTNTHSVTLKGAWLPGHTTKILKNTKCLKHSSSSSSSSSLLSVVCSLFLIFLHSVKSFISNGA